MCYHIISPKKIENDFSGKDELMGNLRAAALACGVVASVLGGGFGVAYLTSSTVSTADLVTEENADDPVVSSTNASATASTSFAVNNEKTTTYKRTTTKKSYTAENTTAASKYSMYAQEGTSSQYSTEAATAASQISRSVPAPAHAPAALTQPSTQAATTAAKVAKVTEGQMRQAIERGDELRQSLWEAEEAETYALEFTDGRRIVVKAVEMGPKNIDRLFEKGMDSRPRLKDARIVFPARDLQADRAWQDQ